MIGSPPARRSVMDRLVTVDCFVSITADVILKDAGGGGGSGGSGSGGGSDGIMCRGGVVRSAIINDDRRHVYRDPMRPHRFP